MNKRHRDLKQQVICQSLHSASLSELEVMSYLLVSSYRRPRPIPVNPIHWQYYCTYSLIYMVVIRLFLNFWSFPQWQLAWVGVIEWNTNCVEILNTKHLFLSLTKSVWSILIDDKRHVYTNSGIQSFCETLLLDQVWQ